MSIIDKRKKPLATGTLEQEIVEINLLLAEATKRADALGLRLICSVRKKPKGGNK